MIHQRDKIKTGFYFTEFIAQKQKSTAGFESILSDPSRNGNVKSIFYAIFRNNLELWIARYSAGEDILLLKGLFNEVVDSLEDYQKQEGYEPIYFKGLTDYIQSLWLISIALLLNVSDGLVSRIIADINQTGKDRIFDRLVQLRFPDREISGVLSHPKTYLSLNNALMTGGDKQKQLILFFIDNYYSGIKDVYWVDTDYYFGRWLFELGAFVKLLKIDDRAFRHNMHYPLDLVYC